MTTAWLDLADTTRLLRFSLDCKVIRAATFESTVFWHELYFVC